VTSGFEFDEGCCDLVLQTELGAEVLFECPPREEGWEVFQRFLSEDTVCI